MTQPPDDIPVQVNIRMPWQFHQFLKELAERERRSVNGLIMETLTAAFEDEYKEAVKA